MEAMAIEMDDKINDLPFFKSSCVPFDNSYLSTAESEKRKHWIADTLNK